MKLFNELQNAFTINNQSQVVKALSEAMRYNCFGMAYQSQALYKRAFALMFNSLDCTSDSDNEGYDLIDEALEYLTGYFDLNPFESFEIDYSDNENEYNATIETKTGFFFKMILVDNTDKVIKHIAVKGIEI